ncbi:hypothetical protein BDV96DRAFT_642651 [Lophiotrema nucula]|uniref:Uncharacterized protein n=1 Tax=Lophiotrema nucula TaxID=690887 RepID=A0A6A5ZK24_9PLEO|nr:hypothetical protein BDV96DRAFT_642651 [Lophiotrema nucula]
MGKRKAPTAKAPAAKRTKLGNDKSSEREDADDTGYTSHFFNRKDRCITFKAYPDGEWPKLPALSEHICENLWGDDFVIYPGAVIPVAFDGEDNCPSLILELKKTPDGAVLMHVTFYITRSFVDERTSDSELFDKSDKTHILSSWSAVLFVDPVAGPPVTKDWSKKYLLTDYIYCPKKRNPAIQEAAEAVNGCTLQKTLGLKVPKSARGQQKAPDSLKPKVYTEEELKEARQQKALLFSERASAHQVTQEEEDIPFVPDSPMAEEIPEESHAQATNTIPSHDPPSDGTKKRKHSAPQHENTVDETEGAPNKKRKTRSAAESDTPKEHENATKETRVSSRKKRKTHTTTSRDGPFKLKKRSEQEFRAGGGAILHRSTPIGLTQHSNSDSDDGDEPFFDAEEPKEVREKPSTTRAPPTRTVRSPTPAVLGPTALLQAGSLIPTESFTPPGSPVRPALYD